MEPPPLAPAPSEGAAAGGRARGSKDQDVEKEENPCETGRGELLLGSMKGDLMERVRDVCAEQCDLVRGQKSKNVADDVCQAGKHDAFALGDVLVDL